MSGEAKPTFYTNGPRHFLDVLSLLMSETGNLSSGAKEMAQDHLGQDRWALERESNSLLVIKSWLRHAH